MVSLIAAGNGRADQIYSRGPETLAAEAHTIVAGPISMFSRHQTESSQPPGPDAVPLKWVVAGTVGRPQILKGSASGSIAFTREEQSEFLPYPPERESWEGEYGALGESDEAVIFLLGDPAIPQMKVVPSGAGERALSGLVKEIVTIQKLPDQVEGWFTLLENPRTEEAARVALRSLVRGRTEWVRLGPPIDRFMSSQSAAPALRTFAFGIVVFGLTNECWTPMRPAVVEFLSRIFASENRPRVLLQHMLALRVVLSYTMQEARWSSAQQMRVGIVQTLRSKEPAVSTWPELAAQYRQIRLEHPGLL
jgi:hypothetical protein